MLRRVEPTIPTIRFAPSGLAVRVAPGTSLLAAIRRAGLPAASACGGDGLCGRCGVVIEAGAAELPRESMAEADAKRRNRVAPHLRLACRVIPTGDLEISAPYW